MQALCRQASKLTLVLALCAALAPAALADSFRVQGMTTQRTQGVYYLNADLGLKLNRQAREALSHGVALTFVVNIKVERKRGWWIWDKTVAALTERYRLSYRPLAERYRLDNLNSGANEEYPTRQAALSAISHIRKLPVIDATLLDAHARYYVLLRVVLDTHDLPGPLKLLAAILPGWRQASGWRRTRLMP